jgi:hypothetical protein
MAPVATGPRTAVEGSVALAEQVRDGRLDLAFLGHRKRRRAIFAWYRW